MTTEEHLRYALHDLDVARQQRDVAEAENERLRNAIFALDLSDDYTLDNAEPGELVTCTRPVEVWRTLAATLRTEERP